jgi:hypothetical protein
MEEEDNEPISGQEMEEFLAAGILPFARSQDGAVMFFLGKELAKGAGRNKYVWSDFGGKREGRDESGEVLPLTAAHMNRASCVVLISAPPPSPHFPSAVPREHITAHL